MAFKEAFLSFWKFDFFIIVKVFNKATRTKYKLIYIAGCSNKRWL